MPLKLETRKFTLLANKLKMAYVFVLVYRLFKINIVIVHVYKPFGRRPVVIAAFSVTG